MSEETTQEQNGARPFEERVLSALAEMRADFNTRLERLEAKQYDTKPIWQQALTEIMQANKRLEDFDVRFDRMESDVAKTRSEMLSLRADFKEFRAHFKEPA
jgi:predicted  nucleic acid-binding Zn-ribbon protein